MIKNDQEPAVTRERVAAFEQLLAALRKTARPEEWPALSSGYRLEIERKRSGVPMPDIHVFAAGGFRCIEAVFQYSGGIAARPRFEIERRSEL